MQRSGSHARLWPFPTIGWRHVQRDRNPFSNEPLSAVEVRLLGSLIEKQATTPESYPLTLNALVLASNQKTSREPVMNLTAGQVGQGMRVLEGAGSRGW